MPVAFADYGADDVAEIVTFFNIFEDLNFESVVGPGSHVSRMFVSSAKVWMLIA